MKDVQERDGHLNLELATGLTVERKTKMMRNGIILKIISLRAFLFH
jgi:hypothetical protein